MEVPETHWFFANNVLVHNCSFCTHGKEKGVRVRSILNIKKEIDQIHEMGYNGLMIFDDIFTYSNKRVYEVGSYLRNKGMKYRCFSHVKYITKVAKALQETNCYEIGIEHKKIRAEDSMKYINFFYDYVIEYCTTYYGG